jgi:hypothetical protein
MVSRGPGRAFENGPIAAIAAATPLLPAATSDRYAARANRHGPGLTYSIRL